TSPLTTPGWTKEAIFTLVGIFIAIASVAITLILASSTVRRCLRRPFRFTVDRGQQEPRHQLRQRYEEWLRFQEYLELTDGRS
ncbi:hypothetical protein EK21DRAFT_49403, partial [Setomelanomma holmii]